MESHGGNVELLEMKDGTARISLEGSCKTCPASTSTLELAIKQALDEAAPDLEALIVEGAENMQPMISGSATELPVLQVAPGEAGVQPNWFALTGAEHIVEGEVRGGRGRRRAACGRAGRGRPARLQGRVRRVRCRRSMTASWRTARSPAPSAPRNYHLPRAGRSLDDDRLQLEPVPLLGGPEGTRVALAA